MPNDNDFYGREARDFPTAHKIHEALAFAGALAGWLVGAPVLVLCTFAAMVSRMAARGWRFDRY